MEVTPDEIDERLGDRYSHYLVLVGLSIGLVASAGCASMVGAMPPSAMTRSRLAVTKDRVEDYWQEQGKLPGELADLPEQSQRDCDINDGWGRPIIYRQLPGNQVALRSLGRDGAPGGDGDDADWEEVFQATP